MKGIVGCVLALALVGCASSGKKLEANDLSSIVVGQTTKDQMMERFGAPMGQSYDTSGQLQMMWQYTHVGFAGLGLHQQLLTVLFDPNGRVAKYNATDNQGENGVRLGN